MARVSLSLLYLAFTVVNLFAQTNATRSIRYINKSFGYSIQISRDTKFVDGSEVKVTRGNNTFVYLRFEERDSYTADLRTSAISWAVMGCMADGPNSSQHCKDIDSARVFLNGNGLTVVKFYLKKFDSVYSDEGNQIRIDSAIVGPYYAIDISNHGVRRALSIEFRPNWSLTPKQTKLSDDIISGLDLLR